RRRGNGDLQRGPFGGSQPPRRTPGRPGDVRRPAAGVAPRVPARGEGERQARRGLSGPADHSHPSSGRAPRAPESRRAQGGERRSEEDPGDVRQTLPRVSPRYAHVSARLPAELTALTVTQLRGAPRRGAEVGDIPGGRGPTTIRIGAAVSSEQ